MTSPKYICLALLPFLLLPVSVRAQTIEVKQIRIVSGWGGLGTGKHNELTISCQSGECKADGKKLPYELIVDLLRAIDSPVIPKPNLANLGITQEWLNRNAEKGIKEYAEFYFSTAAPNQKELYFSSFKNLTFVEKVLPSLFFFIRTDDYPTIEIEITQTNGHSIKLSSDSQPLFMLPWYIAKDRLKTKTYNAGIAKAVANLLPKKFANRDRIAGEGFSRELAETVMREIEDQWETLNVENKAGQYLKQLREKYTIEMAEINGYHNVDHGKEWVNGNTSEINMHATLSSPAFAKNFVIGLALPFRNGTVENVDKFLNSIERYKALALSIPWLNTYIKGNPNTHLELRYVHDRSFSLKAMTVFAKDMKLKEDLVKEIEKIQNDVCLLMVGRKYYQAYWLVLPDKRMVLWRFRGYDALLKWKRDELSRWDCADYQGECVGAVISSDGKLISR